MGMTNDVSVSIALAPYNWATSEGATVQEHDLGLNAIVPCL